MLATPASIAPVSVIESLCLMQSGCCALLVELVFEAKYQLGGAGDAGGCFPSTVCLMLHPSLLCSVVPSASCFPGLLKGRFSSFL